MTEYRVHFRDAEGTDFSGFFTANSEQEAWEKGKSSITAESSVIWVETIFDDEDEEDDEDYYDDDIDHWGYSDREEWENFEANRMERYEMWKREY